MAAPPDENSDWAFDYGLLDDLPPLEPCFQWDSPQDALPPPTSVSPEFDESYGNPDCMKKNVSRKRLRPGVCGASDSKAYKEKMRRDRLNDRQTMLRAKKEKLEHQVKELNARPQILPHHLPPMPSPFAHVVGGKFVPVIGFSGVPMWQLMPPTAVDTSEDHTLRPPVA
ncbi:transcription factor bhlh115 [Phtheirospermum japonicum]|uniref:Transcription factor bhlh115 n=1 Tax=Phtheirospermum japonicum TaxID=374723 RepID=A0A830AXK3_9LAMI|nr:transcription factor bhlh115 [Phtheirospermum japonicum]